MPSSFRLVLVFIGLVCSISGVQAEEPALRATLQAIAASAEANRNAFENGKCIFTYSMWHAASEEEALKGLADKAFPILSRRVEMYFSGESLAIKSPIDRQALDEELSGANGVIVPVNVMRHGHFAIDHDPIVNSAIVYSPETYNLNIRLHPFNLAKDSGATGIIAAVNYAESKKYEGVQFQVKQDVEKEGRTCLLVQKSATYDSHDIDTYLDAKRGYLAFITEDFERSEGHPISSRMRLLDVRQEGDAFFPMHAIRVSFPSQSSQARKGVNVSEMKVEELDLNYQPTPEDLSICFSKQTQYADGINPKTAKTLYRERKEDCTPVKCEDISGLWKELQGIAAVRAKEEQAELASTDRVVNSPKGRRWLILIANGAALAILVLTLLWKRKKA